MKIYIYVLFCTIISLSNCYSQTRDISTIKEFYTKLIQSSPPTESDEIKFFGQESVTRAFLITQNQYKSSKTPVWDALRANRELFLPIGMRNLNEIRISTEIVEFSKFNEANKIPLKAIIVFFIGNRNNHKPMRSVWFIVTPDEKTLMKIDETYINGISGMSVSEFFEVPDRSLKSIGIE